jgi:hypothetical protein
MVCDGCITLYKCVRLDNFRGGDFFASRKFINKCPNLKGEIILGKKAQVHW